jgi:hypothetical protein
VKKIIIIGAIVTTLILAFAIPALAHGPDEGGGAVQPGGSSWQAMHEACESGDWEAMEEAAEEFHQEYGYGYHHHGYGSWEEENSGDGWGGHMGRGWGGHMMGW